MPVEARRPLPRWLAAWGVASVALLLCGWAVAAGIDATPRFDPTDLSVPAGVVALLAVCAASFAAVGALIAARIGNRIGWLLLGIGSCIALTLAGMAGVALEVGWARWGLWVQEWVSLLPFTLMVYLLLLFPTGRLPSARWRPALWFAHLTLTVVLVQPITPYVSAKGGFTNPIGLHALGGSIFSGNQAGFVLLPFATVAAGVSAFARFRRADDVVKQQLKWFALAGSAVVAGYIVQNLAWFSEKWTSRTVAGGGLVVLIVTFAAVPVACGTAILRYRLYDVDRVISRSASYVVLTGIVAALYVAVVAVVTEVLPGSSQLAVASATLVAAAAVNPLRHRVQSAVDRRFNRNHYNAVRLVEEFAAQLRETTSYESVRDRLASVVADALEPAGLSVWSVRWPEGRVAGPLN